MKFEYVGYRPVISHNGVTFKQGKDDKFIYLPYAYEILNALNHEYTTNKNKYSNSINLDNSNIDKLYKVVEIYFPDIEKSIEDKLKKYKEHLEEEREYNFKTTLKWYRKKYISFKSWFNEKL